MEEETATVGRPSEEKEREREGELEEGEILEDDGAEQAEARGIGVGGASAHPLEHSWTFWFDNPSAKSKQAAWGSSIRPVHTFTTVEDFWRIIKMTTSSHRMKRRMGKFMRRFSLSDNANTDTISAVCQNGMLTVTVHKLPPLEPKKPKIIEDKDGNIRDQRTCKERGKEEEEEEEREAAIT